MNSTLVTTLINVSVFVASAAFFVFFMPQLGEARNVERYSDRLSDSQPAGDSNHNFSFTILEAVPPSGHIDIQFPSGFIVGSSTVITQRNIELFVNGSARSIAATPSAANDGFILSPGDGGSLRYILNSSTGLQAGDTLELKIGNQTTDSLGVRTTYSTTTGTTTLPADPKPIQNPSTIGTKKIAMNVVGGAASIDAAFSVAIVDQIAVGPGDTTETIPPFRFNGSPSTTIGGTTLAVEISLETDEFAICKYSLTPDVAFNSMGNTFTDTGLVVHSTVVAVTPSSLNQFYVRCIDDEDNFNIDDYIIAFSVNDQPSGTPNTEGDVEGDGTGSGNEGTGTGGGGGGSSGNSDGGSGGGGSSSGSGGSGGGSGGGQGEQDQTGAGGGFETVDGSYPSGDAEVIIRGVAFPRSDVYAQVDGEVVETSRADANGRYSITLEAIARGAYAFGIYAVDAQGNKSTTFSTSFTVTGGKTSSLSNINVSPTVSVSPDPVNPGETLTVSGYAIPNADITIENLRDGVSLSTREFTAQSDSQGEWSTTIDTSNFSQATYKARASAIAGLVRSGFSEYTFYGVGQEAEGDLNADLNTDGRVNLTDFSILLFWWGGAGGDSSPPADINRDGTVSLTDFSILLFQWTG